MLPRRLRFTRGGLFFSLGALAVGAAAVHSGNNLLFLLLGAMVGMIALNGFVSERMLRGLRVTRVVPAGSPLQVPYPLVYHLANNKTRLPSLAISLRERGLDVHAFSLSISAGAQDTARCEVEFVKRGVYALDRLRIETSFPFGLFTKERRVSLPGELVIWPRTDRPTPDPFSAPGGKPSHTALATAGRPGARGEFESLREFRAGDDLRDVHWRSTARVGTPVVRTYLDDASESRWLVVDVQDTDASSVERALENLASVATRYAREGRSYGLIAGKTRVFPSTGNAHLEAVLDVLARVDVGPDEPSPADVPTGAAVFSSRNPEGLPKPDSPLDGGAPEVGA